MRNADLAEIRARLQAAAAAEARPRPGLFAGLHAPWPRRASTGVAPPALAPASVPPRPAEPAPRSAFGQRADEVEAPLQLDAPLPPEPPLLLVEPIAEAAAPAPRRPARPRRRPGVAHPLLARLEQALLAEQAALDARRA